MWLHVDLDHLELFYVLSKLLIYNVLLWVKAQR